MKISCIEPLGINQQQFEELKKEFASKGHAFEYYMDRQEQSDIVVERMRDAEVVVVSNIKINSEMLSQCPKLRYLSVAFTGLDHIDLAYCSTHGIEVQNAAGYSTTAVSELTLGLMLDLMRRITLFDGSIRHGEGRGTYLGSELRGKTIGVIGTGAIGIATIRLLHAFGCHVIAFSRHERDEAIKAGATYVSKEELLKKSDIVTLHVPLTEETRHLIGEKELQLMKPTALLVNTARGPVMDIEAVALALQAGTIAGAATDVYEKEPPLPCDHPLLHAPNCICLPHVGFATREAFDIRANIVFNHVRDWLAK